MMSLDYQARVYFDMHLGSILAEHFQALNLQEGKGRTELN